MQVPLPHRLRTLLAIPLLVVAVVAGGSTGLAGLQLTSAPDTAPTAALQARQEVLSEQGAPLPEPTSFVPADAAGAWSDEVPDARAAWPMAVLPAPTLAAPERPDSAVASQPVAKKVTQSAPSAPREFVGTDHFWMPALGISKRVHDYPCPRKRPPDNYVYRWWCAGHNNVYLLGHAATVFKPLHDAYVKGRLRVGMAAWYANANGKVTKYRITEWRVVRPEESHWAIADQPVPSMTLQTCVGKNDEFRLNVRLVAVAYL
ncbi:MAG TPA: sortase [Candidatus Deferrimicrobiaceae bacterium]|nr:sortase [Candidatus Deferrimicrobiaceae bacterium]